MEREWRVRFQQDRQESLSKRVTTVRVVSPNRFRFKDVPEYKPKKLSEGDLKRMAWVGF